MKADEFWLFEDEVIKISLPGYLKKSKRLRFFSSVRKITKDSVANIGNLAISITAGTSHFAICKFSLSQGDSFIFDQTRTRLIHRESTSRFDLGYESLWATENKFNGNIMSMRYNIVFVHFPHTFELGVLGNGMEDKFLQLCHFVVSSIDFP